MALGDGTAWDITVPADTDLRSKGAIEIRDLRTAVGIRMDKEHVDLASSSAGGEHIEGSAIVYTEDTVTFPTNKPDGATALDAADHGRVAVIAGKLHFYNAIVGQASWDSGAVGSFTIVSLNTFTSFIDVGAAFRGLAVYAGGGINGLIIVDGLTNETARFMNSRGASGTDERLEFQTEQDSGTPADAFRFRVRSATTTGTFQYMIFR